MFEAVQFTERAGAFEPVETILGEFPDEASAVETARKARQAFVESGSQSYAWWIVRRKGARLAEFIADSKTDKEFVLDLTSGQLVEV